jgi:3-oxoacyl-[acyl-carrier protein] reductase
MSRSVLVTGASKGIGEATVREFARADDIADIILLARPSEEFADLVKEMRAEHPEIGFHPYEVDLADKDATLAVVRQVMADHKRVDLLINNAGFTSPAPIPQIDFADFERTIAVNLYAPFLIVQELMHLGNRFELVVNIS